MSDKSHQLFLQAQTSIKNQFYGQGPAHPITPISNPSGKPLDEEAFVKDTEVGFTNPNLHRRIDPQQPNEQSSAEGEHAPREYCVGIYGVNSYRTEHKVVHLEESSKDEIP